MIITTIIVLTILNTNYFSSEINIEEAPSLSMMLPSTNDPNKLEIKKNIIQQQLPIFKAKQVRNRFNANHNH